MASPQKSNESAEPSADPVIREKVDLARNFTFQLLKGIKQIGMYRHNEAKFPEFLAKPHEALTEYTEKHGPLSLKVEQQNFLLHKRAAVQRGHAAVLQVLPGRHPPAHLPPGPHAAGAGHLHPDRALGARARRGRRARPALEVEHGAPRVRGGRGLHAWTSSPRRRSQVEVDKVVGYLYARLRTNSDDYLRFARVTADDLDAQLEGVEQMRGVVMQRQLRLGRRSRPKLQREIDEEEHSRLFPKLVSAIFQVVEGGVDDLALLEEIFVQLLDAMLIQDDYGTINQMVLKLRAHGAARGRTRAAHRRLLGHFVQKMGDEQRLMRHGRGRSRRRGRRTPADIIRYLAGAGRLGRHPAARRAGDDRDAREPRAAVRRAGAASPRRCREPFVDPAAVATARRRCATWSTSWRRASTRTG